MYTVTLKKVEADINFPNVSVSTLEFNNGVRIVTDVERGLYTCDSLKNYCQDKIRALEIEDSIPTEQTKIDDFIKNPPLGVIDLTPPPPTDEEVLQQKISNLRDLKEQVDLGLVDQVDYDVLLADTKALKSRVLPVKLQQNEIPIV
jgi:hypothetical protein